jgi:hypothetical protein
VSVFWQQVNDDDAGAGDVDDVEDDVAIGPKLMAA